MGGGYSTFLSLTISLECNGCLKIHHIITRDNNSVIFQSSEGRAYSDTRRGDCPMFLGRTSVVATDEV